MKKNLFAILLLFIYGNIFPQESSELSTDDCMARFSTYYHQNFKNKNYAEAYNSWSISFYKCIDKFEEKYRLPIITHGRIILKDRIVKAKNDKNKKDYISELFAYYDTVISRFPSLKPQYLQYKGEDLFRYTSNFENSYSILKEAINIDSNDVQITALDAFFKNSTFLYNKKKLTDIDVFADFDLVMDKLDILSNKLLANFNNLEKDTTSNDIKENLVDEIAEKDKKKAEILIKQNEALITLANNIDNLIAPIASKEKIVKLYTAKFEENKNNENWLKSAISMLSRKKCFKEPIYKKVAEEYHKIKPTYRSAKSLGLMCRMNGDYEDAFKFYKESLDLAANKDEKAESYTNMAFSLANSKRKSEGRKYAYEALKIKPKFGSAYLAIGILYIESANECGNNIFEKKSVYWAAIEQLRKAMLNAESGTTRDQAESLIKNYQPQTPDKELIFQYNYLGKEFYTVGCWINEIVRIPKL